MAKTFRLVINVLLIILIVILSIYVVLSLIDKVEIYSVKTGSMEDNIHVGDYVLVVKKNNYEVGDIITYNKDNYFVTHRIIKKNNNDYITKGDANNTEDEMINISNVIGKVVLSGGILNFTIKYKYLLAGLFASMYLISCYFDSEKKVIKE